MNRKSGKIEFGLVVENADQVSSDEAADPDKDQDLSDPDDAEWKPRKKSNKKRRRKKSAAANNFSTDDDDTEDDDSDDAEETMVKPGYARIAWHPKGNEEVVAENRIKISDRSLVPGDVVKRTDRNKNSQSGMCKSVKVYAAVMISGTKQVVYGVENERIEWLSEFPDDLVVCKSPWVGVTSSSSSEVTLVFNDGSVCLLNDNECDMLDKMDKLNNPEVMEEVFYIA